MLFFFHLVYTNLLLWNRYIFFRPFNYHMRYVFNKLKYFPYSIHYHNFYARVKSFHLEWIKVCLHLNSNLDFINCLGTHSNQLCPYYFDNLLCIISSFSLSDGRNFVHYSNQKTCTLIHLHIFLYMHLHYLRISKSILILSRTYKRNLFIRILFWNYLDFHIMSLLDLQVGFFED